MRAATVLLPLLLLAGCAMALKDRVSFEELEDRVRVTIGNELFTEYVFRGHSRPVLYPVIAAGHGLTRNWPMTDGEENEAKDHPHHRSLWFAHGSVNGHDFWAEGPKRGRIEHVEFIPTDDVSAISSRNRWVAGDGTVVCTDTRVLRFRASGKGRILDYEVTLHASHGDVKLGDTKEGTMAIRHAPQLRLEGPVATGKAVNSTGVTGKAVWGKRAAWVDYHGTIDGDVVGVAIFDHPKNFAHPTWWHAREYGLVAANPFGVHHFEKKPAGTGDLFIPSGDSVTLKYRFVFHEGDTQAAGIEELFRDYAEQRN